MVLSFAFWVGVSISIDIFFYTLAKATSEKLSFLNWTAPAAFAHVVLMGTIIGGIYLLDKSFASLLLPIGIGGFCVVNLYLYELMAKWQGKISRWSLTEKIETIVGRRWFMFWLSASVLSVSLDCIPVAAGVAIQTSDWSRYQLALGLCVIGLTVALTTQTSLALTWAVKKVGHNASIKLKTISRLLGNWVVLNLLSCFGLMALVKGFGQHFPSVLEVELYHLLPLTVIWATWYFHKNWQTLWTEQANEILGS